MTDEQIIKALEICANDGDCKDCAINPHKGNYGYCTSLAIKEALDLINRQKTEIADLKDEIAGLKETNKHLSNEYIALSKEHDRLKAEIENYSITEKDLRYRNKEFQKVNKKQAEYIENLESELRTGRAIRAEAIKEFAERVKSFAYTSNDWSHGEHPYVVEVEVMMRVCDLCGEQMPDTAGKTMITIEYARPNAKTANIDMCIRCKSKLSDARSMAEVQFYQNIMAKKRAGK